MTDQFEHYDELSYPHDVHVGADGAARSLDMRTQRLFALAIAVVVLLLVLLVAAQSGISGSSRGALPRLMRSSATGVEVRVPGQATQRIAAAQPIVGQRPSASRTVTGYSYPADGSLVTITAVDSTARLGTGSAAANGQVDVASVTLFNGRIKLTGLSMRAQSSVRDSLATGSVGLAPGAVLLVDGKPETLDANRQVVIPNVGTVSINEQAVVSSAPGGDSQTGPRHHVVGAAVHVRLSASYAGAPAGTEVIIGRVESGVRDRKVAAIKHPASSAVQPVPTPVAAITPLEPAVVSTGGSTFSPQTGVPKPGDTALPRRTATVKGQAAGGPTGNLQGYVFPVLSAAATFSDDWGGFRADVPGGHQGNDIFAPEGTPIVAVADGVLDRVGWNAIGGYRFWLFDQYGNGFYHCHLSAYAPLAVDGARVHAGDVIGFVGHTGDAQGTPNHVHFEVHPNNGPATDPFPFITAWQHGVAVAISALPAAGGTSGSAPITLLSSADIAPNSGLESSVLSQVQSTDRPVSQESVAVPTDAAMKQAIDGGGISAG